MDWDKIVADLEKFQAKGWAFEKKLFGSLKSLFIGAVEYLIALYIYLWIYDVYGWERTLIALGVGFIVFSLRERVKNVRG